MHGESGLLSMAFRIDLSGVLDQLSQCLCPHSAWWYRIWSAMSMSQANLSWKLLWWCFQFLDIKGSVSEFDALHS